MASSSFRAAWTTAAVLGLGLLGSLITPIQAQDPATVRGTNSDGLAVLLPEDRVPRLYTGDFGDCMGGQSLLNMTSFDAGYYTDNATVFFNIRGTTNLRNESVMMFISVEAYGEQRFQMPFNPCDANFKTLCPLNASEPVVGGAIIPVSPIDVANIPSIAFSIPDFEGSAILRIYSNRTQDEIGCFKAVMTNGATMSHPVAVSSVLGVFTFVALLASFATAIYGVSIPHMRTHHAHSLSVMVIFEVFQSIFFSSALSLNWPSVNAAFWSNFAWSAGQIYTSSILSSINSFVDVSGNSSQVGGAGSTVLSTSGGQQQLIYGRSFGLLGREETNGLLRRAVNETTAPSRMYSWAGTPVAPGLPIPGNWSNFAGELAVVGIPAASAFLVGLVWFLILLAILVGAVVAFKYALEMLVSVKWIKDDRLELFRQKWLGFLGLVVLRTFFIGFFMMMTLSLYQFSIGGKAGPIAIAAIVFIIFFTGALGIAAYACFYRAKSGRYESRPDRIHFQQKKIWKIIPFYKATRESSMADGEDKAVSSASVPLPRIQFQASDAEKQNIHEDVDFTKRFGWLAGRYRRTRWWFFAFWVVYQFVRACFVGGARANPTGQVIGLLVWEVIALVAIAFIKPFEGARNTTLAVYMLGFSKVATAGLSIAFLPQFSLARIPTTVVGIIIVVIQGFLVIALMVLIVLSAISSYMSITRNREEFRPRRLENIRIKYFNKIEKKAADLPPTPPAVPEEPGEPYFSVNTVRRAPKIEDEDVDDVPDMQDMPHPGAQAQHALSNRNSRSNSMRSNYSTVPYGARVHRASWSSHDFQNWQNENQRVDSPLGTQSRTASGLGSYPGAGPSSLEPLTRPQPSLNQLRPATPTQVKTSQYSNQRTPSGA